MPDVREILPVDPQLLRAALFAAAGAVVLWIAVRIVRSRAGRKQADSSAPDELTIDVAQLPALGPPADAPQIEVYNTPMRLAVLVLAPVGRTSSLPDLTHTGSLIDSISPGMKRACDTHLPLVRRWPAQLSTQGFANSFFAHVVLPGDGGKSSPWTAVTGSFRYQGKRYLAGLICRADSANGIGQIIVSRDEAWPEVLRVKS